LNFVSFVDAEIQFLEVDQSSVKRQLKEDKEREEERLRHKTGEDSVRENDGRGSSFPRRIFMEFQKKKSSAEIEGNVEDRIEEGLEQMRKIPQGGNVVSYVPVPQKQNQMFKMMKDAAKTIEATTKTETDNQGKRKTLTRGILKLVTLQRIMFGQSPKKEGDEQ
jgi:ABC-type dipeptide/oligopeptide/nickel transport system ATPase subunit